METIEKLLRKLGYSFYWQIIKASDFGSTSSSIFIVGFLDDERGSFEFPDAIPLEMFMSDIFGEPCNKSVGYTLRVGGKSSGLNDRRNWDTYMVNGKIVKLNYYGKKMQGFPDGFEFPVSETQAMKQLGNSVAVPAVKATAQKVFEYLNG